MTANELARFMVAGDTGRMGIIRNARESSAAPRIRYSTVRQEIRSYLCNMARTERTLDAIRGRFDQRAADPSLDTWTREDARLSIDVLDGLAAMNNQIAGHKFLTAPQQQPPLEIMGVTVSVYLDVLISKSKGIVEEIGGVLFRMTKSDDETESAAAKRRDMGAYAATLALMQVAKNFSKGARPHHLLCASFDIQCKEIHYAPRSFAQRAKNMENACRFISAVWSTA